MKKHLKFKDGSQVWRILISSTDKIVFETRNTEKKEAFFSCYKLDGGKKLFKGLQPVEKYWTGIEDVYEDIILFHRFAKPDMPGHKSIIAFDVLSKEILWENNEYSFLFLLNNKIYCFVQKFEGRRFYTIDPYSGKLLEELGDDSFSINEFKYKADEEKDWSGYLFPRIFNASEIESVKFKDIVYSVTDKKSLNGEIEYAEYKNKLYVNFHYNVGAGILENKLIVYDITIDKIIFSEILNSAVISYVPDSFFIYKDYLILLKEKNEVIVYKLE